MTENVMEQILDMREFNVHVHIMGLLNSGK